MDKTDPPTDDEKGAVGFTPPMRPCSLHLELQNPSSPWNVTRCQTYFIDKLGKLKIRIRKCEEDNQALLQYLEQERKKVSELETMKVVGMNTLNPCLECLRFNLELRHIRESLLQLYDIVTSDDQVKMNLIETLTTIKSIAEQDQPIQDKSSNTILKNILNICKSWNLTKEDFSKASNISETNFKNDPNKTVSLVTNEEYDEISTQLVDTIFENDLLRVKLHRVEKSLSVEKENKRCLEDNFKKQIRKVCDIEKRLKKLLDCIGDNSRERDELNEKNIFLEEENLIQREQILLLEETLREIEDGVKSINKLENSTQTDLCLQNINTLYIEVESLKQKLAETESNNLEEVVCLATKINEILKENEQLKLKYELAVKDGVDQLCELESLKKQNDDLKTIIDTYKKDNRILKSRCKTFETGMENQRKESKKDSESLMKKNIDLTSIVNLTKQDYQIVKTKCKALERELEVQKEENSRLKLLALDFEQLQIDLKHALRKQTCFEKNIKTVLRNCNNMDKMITPKLDKTESDMKVETNGWASNSENEINFDKSAIKHNKNLSPICDPEDIRKFLKEDRKHRRHSGFDEKRQIY